jgi:hypothetical protein
MPDQGLAGVEIARSIALYPSDSTTYALTTSNTSAAIPIGKASFGTIHVVTTGAATLTAYASESTTAASFEALTDSNGTAVTIAAAAAGWYELPSACLSVPFLQLRTNTSTATIRLYLKG